MKYRVHYYESERGWGSDRWTSDFDTREKAQKAFDECNAKNPPGPAPDYYIIATKIEEIE